MVGQEGEPNQARRVWDLVNAQGFHYLLLFVRLDLTAFIAAKEAYFPSNYVHIH